MGEINRLTREELIELYPKVVQMRKDVLELVQKYGYNVETLISRTFEHDVEMVYGRKVLNGTD